MIDYHSEFVKTVHDYLEDYVDCVEIIESKISAPISLRGTISCMFACSQHTEDNTMRNLRNLVNTIQLDQKFKIECYTLYGNYNYHVLILKPIKEFGWIPPKH
jgi:hypothetical protein